MSGAEFYRAAYTPDYREMFAVQRASRRHHYTKAQRLAGWVIFAGLVPAIVLVGKVSDAVADLVAPLVGDEVAGFVFLPMLLLVWGVWTWGVCYTLLPWLSARWITERKPPRALEFSADDDTLRWEGPDNGMWVRWSEIERIFVTKEAIGFLSGGWSYITPRRVFASPADMASFINSAMKRLSPEARSRTETDGSIKAILAK